MGLGVPKYIIYAQAGPIGDYFTAQAWTDDELDRLMASSPHATTLTVFVARPKS